MDELRMKTCPFCVRNAELVVQNPELYGATGAFVRCISCRARTVYFGISKTVITQNGISTPITGETIQRGANAALEAWNRRDSSNA